MGGFDGFGGQALGFLTAVGFHQSRDWMNENRSLYESELRGPMRALLEDLGPACTARGVPLRGDPDRGLFRLNRDIRFAKDKRPYNTHAGAVISRDGSKRSLGVVYLHVDPAGSFLAAGFYHPEPSTLALLRRAIVARPARWRAVEAALAAGGLEISRDDALTRLPRDFSDCPDELAATIKLRSLIVTRPIDLAMLRERGLLDAVVDFAAAALLLLEFGWSVVDG